MTKTTDSRGRNWYTYMIDNRRYTIVVSSAGKVSPIRFRDAKSKPAMMQHR